MLKYNFELCFFIHNWPKFLSTIELLFLSSVIKLSIVLLVINVEKENHRSKSYGVKTYCGVPTVIKARIIFNCLKPG